MNERELSKIHITEPNRAPDGSLEAPFIESDMSVEEIQSYILSKNPEAKDIIQRQQLLDVMYLNKDGKFCVGQIYVDKDLAPEVREFFKFLLDQKFLIEKIVPIQDKKYDAQDESSMQDNNTSAENYRYISGTTRLSLHAFGFAIDLNPRDNPVQLKGETIAPIGAVRNPEDSQTFTAEHPVVKWLEERGWEWGGHWIEPYSDYHHFQKPLATKEYTDQLLEQLQAGKITQEQYDQRLSIAQKNLESLHSENS